MHRKVPFLYLLIHIYAGVPSLQLGASMQCIAEVWITYFTRGQRILQNPFQTKESQETEIREEGYG